MRDLAEAFSKRRDEVVSRQIDCVRETQPIYVSLAIPTGSLEIAANQNVDRAVAAIKAEKAPAEADVDETWIARARAEEGLPLVEMLDGFRLKHRVIRDAFLETAEASGASWATTSLSLGLLGDTADVCASRLLLARREVDEDMKVHNSEADVLALVRKLLSGELPVCSVLREATHYGLRPELKYFAVRARAQSGGDTMRMRDSIRTSSWRDGHSGLVVAVGDEVLGLVPRYPSQVPAEMGVVAVGPANDLFEAAHSFQCASRILRAAERFDLTGTFSQSDLSLRLAVASEPEVNLMLIDRYFAPLAAEGEFGVLLETSIREFLGAGGELKRAARALHVHPNTLKHRLARFQDLANCELGDPKTVAELWWAVEARSIAPPSTIESTC